MALKRLCPKCKVLINNTEKYCEKCTKEYQEKKRERDKEYNIIKRDKKSSKFYNSKEWKRLREQVKIRDNGLCVLCLSNKIIKSMDIVHHIVELKEDYNSRLDINNLVSLCNTCHNHVHIQYNSSDKGKLQDLLFNYARGNEG